MTRKQAQNMMDDLGKHLTDEDYVDDIYLSINGVGTKIFKKCSYFETEGFTFIWTKSERFLISKKELGSCVIIPRHSNTSIKLKKVS